MRNSWVAIIGVLMIASFAGTSYATAPVVSDIPDFRLLTVTGQVDDFELGDYVTDIDDADADLTWSIQSQTGFGGATPVSLAGSLMDIAGDSNVTQGVVTLRATAPDSEYSEDDSTIKYSTFMLIGPGLTQDRNLTPDADVFPRSWVIQAGAPITTSVISDLILPSSASGADLTVSIADMDGNWLAGDNATSASVSGLEASLTAGGELVLQAPGGAYPITGLYEQLTEAYRVGIKAKLTGGAGENWDGMELLVSHGRFPTKEDPNTEENLAKFSGFDGVTPGALPTSFNAIRGANEDNARWWNSTLAADQGTATVAIVDTGIPTSTWNASSDQALEFTMNAAGETITIQSEMFTDIEPGDTVTLAANVTTNVTSTDGADGVVPNIIMFMGSFHSTSNYDGLLLQDGPNPAAADQVPLDGEWRTIKVSFTADKVGAAVDDGGTPVDFYAQGYQAAIAVTAPAGGSFPIKVYVDNVKVYTDKSNIDKALGATEIAVAKNSPNTELFDGSFADATTTDPADLGWGTDPVSNNGNYAIDLGTPVSNSHSQSDTNAMRIWLTSPATRTTTYLQFAINTVALNATTAGGVDYRGDGLFAMTAWIKSDAAAPKNCPGVMLGVTDLNWKNVPFTDCGHAGLPLQGGGWKKVQAGSARFGAGKFNAYFIVRADYPAVVSRPYWGSFQDTERPGYVADASVYVDDIQFHKVMDEAMYFDRSVFPAAD